MRSILRALPWTALMLGLSLVMAGSALAYEQADSLTAAAQADSVQISTPPPPQPDQVAPPPAAPAPATTATPPPVQAQATAPPPAQKQQPTGPFGKGTRRASFTAGWGRSFGEDYLLLGLGVGYFFRNNMALNLSLETWALNDPNVTKFTPELQMVVPRPRGPRPYLAGFWRRAFIEDADDLSSIGGRAGIYNKIAGRSSAGVGAVYEHYLDCDDKYNTCSQVYPEAVFGVSF